jgi:hypothetical protein
MTWRALFFSPYREGSYFYPGSGPTDDNRHTAGEEMVADMAEPAAWTDEGVLDDPASVMAARGDSTAQVGTDG